MRHCLLIDLLFYKRKNMVPDPVSCVFIRKIAAVKNAGDFFLLQIIDNFFLFQTQNRADNRSVHRTHSGKPAYARTPCKIVKHCLCKVILIVSKCNFHISIGNPKSLFFLSEGVTPHHASRLLKPHLPFLRKSRNRICINPAWYPPFSAHFLHEYTVSVCFALPNLVMNMDCLKGKILFFPKAPQYIQHCHRVSPSGHACKNRIFRLYHMIFFYKIFYKPVHMPPIFSTFPQQEQSYRPLPGNRCIPELSPESPG